MPEQLRQHIKGCLSRFVPRTCLHKRILFLSLPGALLPACAGSVAGAGQAGRADVHAIIYVDRTSAGATAQVLGGTVNDRWVSGHQAAARLRGGERYMLHSLAGYPIAVRGGRPAPTEEDGLCYLPFAASRPVPCPAVGVSGNWNVLPRPLHSQDVGLPLYRQAAADILREHGLLHAAPRITRIVRVDLDGDGTDEVLLEASSTSGDPAGKRPFYSFVALRKVVGGKVKTFMLRGQFLRGTGRVHMLADTEPDNCTIAAILDLSGDGSMEVILNWHGWERGGQDVYAVRRNKALTVLSASYSE